MAFIQRNVPQPNKREQFAIKSFTGGLNNRAHLLAENEASNLLNVDFLDRDLMQKRKGTKPLDSIVTDGEIKYMDTYRTYTDGDWRVTGTDLGVRFDKDGVTHAFPIGHIYSGYNFNGQYFLCNGVDIYVFANLPYTSSTYVSLTGTNPGYALFKVVQPSSGYTPLDLTHRQGKIVVNFTNQTICYEPCQYEIEDPYKGANVPPKKGKYMVSSKGRLFVSGSKEDDDNIFITDVANPLYFPVSLPMQVPPDSDFVRGLYVFDDAIVIGRTNDIYFIKGVTNNPELGFDLFSLQRINTHTGFASHHAVDFANNFLFFLGNDGYAYALTSVQAGDTSVSTSIISQQIDLFKAPINGTREDLSRARSVYFDNKWYVIIGKIVMVYSYLHRAWTMFKFNWYDLATQSEVRPTFLYKDEEMVYYGRSDGRVYIHSDEYLDDIHPFLGLWRSKTFDMNVPSTYKQFREFYLVAHTFDGFQSNIRAMFEIDYDDVNVASVVQNQKAIWGQAKFGDRMITRNINASLPFVIGKRGRNLVFTVANGSDTIIIVPTYEDMIMLTGVYNYDCAYIVEENAHYVLMSNEWELVDDTYNNQPMRVYEVNGEFEFKGKR